jgi:hypothetical protein
MAGMPDAFHGWQDLMSKMGKSCICIMNIKEWASFKNALMGFGLEIGVILAWNFG